MNGLRRHAGGFLLALILGILGSECAADPPAEAVAEAPPREPATEDEIQDADALFLLGQDYLQNLRPYQPMYFLLGTPLSRSKFQLSFRYRFFNPTAPLAQKHPWVQGINFGYTQTSFWDLRSDSKPFEDTSYKPEVFYLSPNAPWRPRWSEALFLHAGIHHESNGRGPEASRSTNLVYFAPLLLVRLSGGLGVGFAPRFKYYFSNSEKSNPDLEDYRGAFEFMLGAGKVDGLAVKSTIRTARRGTSVEVDATYPMSRSWFRDMQIYLNVQYANALAENLLDYRERRESFRIGFAFYR